MISDEIIQAAILAKVKTFTTVTERLAEGANGVKEFQWQGDTFKYPAVRLDLEDNTFALSEQNDMCILQEAEFSLYIYSEERSSKECSQIKGLLATALVGKGFSQNGVKFNRLKLVENVPAIREDEHTWRSQIRLSSSLTLTS